MMIGIGQNGVSSGRTRLDNINTYGQYKGAHYPRSIKYGCLGLHLQEHTGR